MGSWKGGECSSFLAASPSSETIRRTSGNPLRPFGVAAAAAGEGQLLGAFTSSEHQQFLCQLFLIKTSFELLSPADQGVSHTLSAGASRRSRNPRLPGAERCCSSRGRGLDILQRTVSVLSHSDTQQGTASGSTDTSTQLEL